MPIPSDWKRGALTGRTHTAIWAASPDYKEHYSSGFPTEADREDLQKALCDATSDGLDVLYDYMHTGCAAKGESHVFTSDPMRHAREPRCCEACAVVLPANAEFPGMFDGELSCPLEFEPMYLATLARNRAEAA